MLNEFVFAVHFSLFDNVCLRTVQFLLLQGFHVLLLPSLCGIFLSGQEYSSLQRESTLIEPEVTERYFL